MDANMISFFLFQLPYLFWMFWSNGFHIDVFFVVLLGPPDGKPPRRSQFLSDSLVARIALLTENLQGLVAAQSSRTWIFMFVACKNLDRL